MKLYTALSVLLALFYCASSAAQSSYSAQELFDRYRDAIVQVQITNNLSGERSSLGSGFYVSSEGLAVTNYHVVSAVVQNPDDYRVEIIRADGGKERPEVVGFDLINDLALLRTGNGPATPFNLDMHPLHKGARILSLGNPNDLGMTVVNGSYSGNLENSLYERIHFSGAINQGMSGGPALDELGNVIGINVATSGNGVGFLIPAKFGVQLVATNATRHPMSVRESIETQLRRNQERFMEVLLSEQLPVSALGDYRVPDKIAPFMHCWGDSDKEKKGMYEIVMRVCSSRQDVFIDDEYSTGKIYYSHRYLRSEELNALRFSALYQNSFSDSLPNEGEEEYLTNFHCSDDFVDNGSVNLKTSLCLRGHKKVPGLFDWALVAATIEKNRSGVQTSLLLTGVSYENGRKFVEKYLKAITWKE
ncbi:MAG TPA: S1C family serine protease [Gammaproteobacteria bacterium]